jgi:hypothetical protein
MISEKTKIEVQPSSVIYRTPIGNTSLVIKVFLYGVHPRILAYCESIDGLTPYSLFLDEILDYINDAKQRKNL